MKKLTFTVSIPSKEGFVGRACNNPDCEQYFKVSKDSYKDTMYCPYCGDAFSSNELFTSDQAKHVTDVAKEEAFAYIQKQFQGMMKKSFGSSSSRKSGITYKPGRIQRKTITPKYKERTVDSELKCPECGTKFQVYGIFGYCPGCRDENLQIYDANFKIIEKEIDASNQAERQLRHAYVDLVSTFENICSKKSVKVTTEKGNFQVLFDANKFFKKHAAVNILKHVAEDQLLALRRVFQKRHIYVHSDGTINDKYIQKIPEDKALLGQKASLSLSELRCAAEGMRVALGELVKAIEKKG